VLDQNSVLDSENVRCDPIHRQAEAWKPSMDDDEISILLV
jgi:hypothetical protein